MNSMLMRAHGTFFSSHTQLFCFDKSLFFCSKVANRSLRCKEKAGEDSCWQPISDKVSPKSFLFFQSCLVCGSVQLLQFIYQKKLHCFSSPSTPLYPPLTQGPNHFAAELQQQLNILWQFFNSLRFVSSQIKIINERKIQL